MLRQQWELTCAPHAFPCLFLYEIPSKAIQTHQPEVGWLIYSPLIQTEMGRKGLDEPGVSCTGAQRELCCSAQQNPWVPLRREQSCAARPAPAARRAELQCSVWGCCGCVPSSCRIWFHLCLHNSLQRRVPARGAAGLGWNCVCTEMPCFDEKAAHGRQGGLFLQACLCCGCISPQFQSPEEHTDQYPNASAVQTGSASSRSSQCCGCCVYPVCSGGYTSSSVSALAASGRSKIIPPRPGAVSERGGDSSWWQQWLCCAHGAGTAAPPARLQQSRWAEKSGRNSHQSCK